MWQWNVQSQGGMLLSAFPGRNAPRPATALFFKAGGYNQKSVTLLRIIPKRFPAPHLVEHHRVHLAVISLCCPHDDVRDPAVHDHLRAEETRPDLGQVFGLDIKSGEVERTSRAFLPAWRRAFISAWTLLHRSYLGT